MICFSFQKSFFTPIAQLYVRNHHPVPRIDIEKYKLEIVIDGVDETTDFTFDEIVNDFNPVTLAAGFQCAGMPSCHRI